MDSKATASTDASASLDSTVQITDLEQAIMQTRQAQNWKTSDRHATTLFQSGTLRLVLMALHKGGELKTHTAPGIITVQVLEGHITFRTDSQASDLSAGQLLMLPTGIPHSVQAHQESFFLLTVAIASAK